MAKFESKRPNITNQDAKNTKPTDFENKMHDATGLIISLESNILTKIFWGKKETRAKSLATPSKVDRAYNRSDKNRQIMKKPLKFDLS